MTVDEARRHGLYNVLADTIGAEETDTLMALLSQEPAEPLATQASLETLGADLRDEIATIRSEMTVFRSEFNGRLDRLFLTLAAGLLAIVGSVVVQALS